MGIVTVGGDRVGGSAELGGNVWICFWLYIMGVRKLEMEEGRKFMCRGEGKFKGVCSGIRLIWVTVTV